MNLSVANESECLIPMSFDVLMDYVLSVPIRSSIVVALLTTVVVMVLSCAAPLYERKRRRDRQSYPARQEVQNEEADNAQVPKVALSADGRRAGADGQQRRNMTVLYASLTGTSKKFAEDLVAEANSTPRLVGLVTATSESMEKYDPDQLQFEDLLVFVVATYEGGVAPGQSQGFCAWLTDQALDFRVSKQAFAGVCFAVFGCGNSDYDANFNAAARGIESAMIRLGAAEITRRGDGDDNLHIETQFLRWQKKLLHSVANFVCAVENGTEVAGADTDTTSSPISGSMNDIARYGKNQQPGEVRLPLKEYRRRKRKARERAAIIAMEEQEHSSSAEDSGDSADEVRQLSKSDGTRLIILNTVVVGCAIRSGSIWRI
eukprot:SAG31_NODE_595_length_13695_cov_11.446896_1_plen_375_part_00